MHWSTKLTEHEAMKRCNNQGPQFMLGWFLVVAFFVCGMSVVAFLLPR